MKNNTKIWLNRKINSSQNSSQSSKGKLAIITMIITVMMFSLALTGCGQSNVNKQESSGTADISATQTAPTEQKSTNAQDAGNQDTAVNVFPLKVTDANGFEMTIESEPQRIISLTLGSDEMLLGLVDTNRVLALTKYADDEGISNVSAEAAGVVERVSMDKIENIIALKPDMVILDTWADAKYVKQLRDAGITVYVFKTPSNIDEQKATILEFAHITGAEAKGQEIVNWMDTKLKDVESKLAQLKDDEKLTVMDYGEMGSSGKGTNVDDIMTRAGLINVVARAGMENWPTISKEKIIEFNPDIMILPSWYYDKANSLQGMIDTLKNDKSLQTVKAVSGDRLIAIPNPHISAISQYVVLAVEDLAKAAYPELFK